MSSANPRIVVVDDDPALCTSVLRLLRGRGLTAAAFTLGPAFLATLETEPPDCVVLDIRMPVMTGFEVQAGMRARGCLAPVIFISAGDTAPKGRDDAGPAWFLAKPFDEEDLVRAIAEALAERPRGG